VLSIGASSLNFGAFRTTRILNRTSHVWESAIKIKHEFWLVAAHRGFIPIRLQWLHANNAECHAIASSMLRVFRFTLGATTREEVDERTELFAAFFDACG
jgi:hypothetical protein